MICGIAGALYVPQVGIINPSEMSPANSIEIAIWVAVGGRGTLVGAILGAGLVNGAKSFFTQAFPEYWLFLLGLLFILVTLFLPQGVMGLLQQEGRAMSTTAIAANEARHARAASRPAGSTPRTARSSTWRTSASASTASRRSTSCRSRSTSASCAA